MAILFVCECGKRFKVPDDSAGKRAKCSSCGQISVIPAPAPAEPEPQAEEPRPTAAEADPEAFGLTPQTEPDPPPPAEPEFDPFLSTDPEDSVPEEKQEESEPILNENLDPAWSTTFAGWVMLVAAVCFALTSIKFLLNYQAVVASGSWMMIVSFALSNAALLITALPLAQAGLRAVRNDRFWINAATLPVIMLMVVVAWFVFRIVALPVWFMPVSATSLYVQLAVTFGGMFLVLFLGAGQLGPRGTGWGVKVTSARVVGAAVAVGIGLCMYWTVEAVSRVEAIAARGARTTTMLKDLSQKLGEFEKTATHLPLSIVHGTFAEESMSELSGLARPPMAQWEDIAYLFDHQRGSSARYAKSERELSLNSLSSDKPAMIAWDAVPDNKNYRNVVFLDGSTVFMPEGEFQAQLSELEHLIVKRNEQMRKPKNVAAPKNKPPPAKPK